MSSVNKKRRITTNTLKYRCRMCHELYGEMTISEEEANRIRPILLVSPFPNNVELDDHKGAVLPTVRHLCRTMMPDTNHVVVGIANFAGIHTVIHNE